MIRNKHTGQFQRTPEGQKTPKMLEVEKRLGRTLEEDFYEYYVKKGFGQKRLAQRWGVKRSTIFSMTMRGGRRCWVQMLNLPVRSTSSHVPTQPPSLPSEQCEICGMDDLPLDGAHWVNASDGGSDKPYNRIRLCPNCHRRLHAGDQETQREARSALLYREVNKLLESNLNVSEKKSKLVELATAIIERKPIRK